MGNDKRYTITREYTGAKIQQFVSRFCGDFIGSADTIQGAYSIESNHIAKRGHDLLARFDDGDGSVLWLKRGNSHRIVYGADIYDTNTKTAGIDAAHRFGECVLHSITCAGLLD